MHDGTGRIVVQGLTKQFGPVTAVQNLGFTVEPGTVTGFLGPNGSGKTTTLRMLLGLVHPTTGQATINGRRFDQLGNPARVVGAVLEAQSFHPTRSAYNHLRSFAAAIGAPDRVVNEVLGLVGLYEAGRRKPKGFSLGMRQRLALATALLGDPQVLVLDEPSNGLDPEGIAWLRGFLRDFASRGRTVLISSHLLREVEQTVDQVVIISRGQSMYHGSLDQLRAQRPSRVLVQTDEANKLVGALREAGHQNIESTPDGRLAIGAVTTKQVAEIAAKAGAPVYGIQEEHVDLESLFLEMTSGQYVGAPGFGQQQHQQQPPPGWGPPPGSGGFPAQNPYQQQGGPQQGGYPPQGPPQGGYPQVGYPQGGAPPSNPYNQPPGNQGQPGTGGNH
ncbi:ABC transporter ATP-binding protein [Actinoalloteichus hymeniacidonis]|uniref:ABC-type multidrug transport system, ATPase component n=1 Tax=Actinoalloteichus hymeniacidonis TaxID=340345 RepID=A0AAC9HU59_9PSEU|nr:ATP-binding cassette domain-containing protein [Actinoalloteichus hymeniacidonis]AOS65379.1 ABC-type multidrug transport system, ATPase component [Actinoalloteichus hymeniacidonis]MBB5906535.1 ABC-2 type transport system ATP-binding protein [Actinoalloteichus hymeniacidonis]